MAKKIFGNEIGAWTELKLEYIKKYLEAYSNILRSKFPEYHFIDAFAGSGFCKKRKTRELIYGSPLIALNIQPPFTKYFFIELNKNKADCLEAERKNNYPNLDAKIKNGDCNIIIDSILSCINDSIPFIALLDPQAGDLYWETIYKISLKRRAEVLINFPFGMAIRRYMPFTKGKNILQNMKNKLNKIFGNNNWEGVYEERKRHKISSTVAREKYLDLYLKNLTSIGFEYYASKNIKNSQNNHIYYLIFATKHIKGLEIMKDIMVKDESERNSLYRIEELNNLANDIYDHFKCKSNLNLQTILKKLLPGKHLYTKQDFKEALKILETKKKLIRLVPRQNAKSFNDNELFNIE